MSEQATQQDEVAVSPDRVRKLLVSELNDSARDVFEGHRRAWSECKLFAMRKKHLVAMVNELSITPDEAQTCLSIIYRDETEPKDGNDERLIETALDYINQQYERGKYEGRDAVGFFRTLFERIDEQLLLRLDEQL